LDFLKDNFQDKLYSLSFDEMSIRKQVQWDGSSMKGFVDLAGVVEESGAKQASSALFVMATQVNGSLKIPIAYFLTNGCSGRLLSAIIRKSLSQMQESNSRVISISFDGLKGNLAAARRLGANLDLESPNYKTSFSHPITGRILLFHYVNQLSYINIYLYTSGDEIFIVPDICHMVKLLRNTLDAYGAFLSTDGKRVGVNLDNLIGITLISVSTLRFRLTFFENWISCKERKE